MNLMLRNKEMNHTVHSAELLLQPLTTAVLHWHLSCNDTACQTWTFLSKKAEPAFLFKELLQSNPLLPIWVHTAYIFHLWQCFSCMADSSRNYPRIQVCSNHEQSWLIPYKVTANPLNSTVSCSALLWRSESVANPFKNIHHTLTSKDRCHYNEKML